jgi:hypothetical protein
MRTKLEKETRELLGVKSDREWRTRKRRELTAVLKAAEVYLMGSAYTPMSACDLPSRAMSLLDLVRHMRAKLAVKEWGR